MSVIILRCFIIKSDYIQRWTIRRPISSSKISIIYLVSCPNLLDHYISFNTAIDTVIETTKQTIKYKQSPTQKAQQPKAVSYRANVIKTRTCLEVHKWTGSWHINCVSCITYDYYVIRVLDNQFWIISSYLQLFNVIE